MFLGRERDSREGGGETEGCRKKAKWASGKCFAQGSRKKRNGRRSEKIGKKRESGGKATQNMWFVAAKNRGN